MSCPICACPFTNTVRKPMKCVSCAFESCQTCTKTYLLGSTQDAHCMSCRIAWSYNFLIDTFSKAFVSGDYKRHREKVLVEREKSMLVETMPLVETEKEKRQLAEDAKILRLQINECKLALKNLKRQLETKTYKLYYLNNNRSRDTSEPRKQYIRACPATDCKGFLSTAWICGLCQVHVCSKCHEIKHDGGDHTCTPENIETANAVMKETRPCPKCAARIFKIGGCDQMWCTSCNTAFSWRTGNVEQGRVHNPHYFEYLRQNATAPPPPRQNRGCDDVLVDARELIYHLRYSRIQQDPHPLVTMLRGFTHIHRTQMPTIRDPREEFANLRLRYLMGDFNETRWKQLLQACEKRNEKQHEKRMILDTLIIVSTELFRRALQSKLPAEIDSITAEMLALINHINDSFQTYATRFGCTAVNFIHPTKYVLDSRLMKQPS